METTHKETSQKFIVGIFSDEDDLLHAVEEIRHEGVNIHEVYSPYPVHGLEHALGYKRSRMPVAAFLFGTLGFILAVLMQGWMMGIDWPMIIGGKPYIAIPALVPVTFEMTVLLSAFGMAFTFFFVRNLKPHGVPVVFDRRSTDDKHVMAIDLSKNTKSESQISEMLKKYHADEVRTQEMSQEDLNPTFGKYFSDLLQFGVQSSSKIN